MGLLYAEALVGLAVGLAVFMYGMTAMSEGLEAVAGKKIHKFLARVSSNRFSAVGTGTVATAVLHSSAATTVMVEGFVNSGFISLFAATGIIMGANIGTTVTGLLIALGSLDLSLYLMIPAVIGVALIVFKNGRYKSGGAVLFGFGLIFLGLDLMSSAVVGVSDTDIFRSIFLAIDNPILLMILGAAVTAIVQSSTAINGLLIALSVPMGQNGINIVNALFIILGTNVGTCMTATIAAAGSGIGAKRTAMIHLLFNVIGTVIFGIILFCIEKNTLAAFLTNIFGKNVKFQIALFNLVQNTICTIIMLPFIKQLVWLVEKLVKEDKNVKSKKEIKHSNT